MSSSSPFFPVNWVDGMKISKSHFQQTDNYIRFSNIETNALLTNPYNYGLLASQNGKSSFEFSLQDGADNFLELKINSCQAVTRGGVRINITETNALSYTVDGGLFDLNGSYVIDILIVVNPFVRVPYGSPAVEEYPFRYPFTDNSYSIQVITASANSSGVSDYQLKIGEIKVSGGKLSFNRNYIPACMSVKSHQALIKKHEDWGHSFQNIHSYSIGILKKIFDKSKASQIAVNFRMICEHLILFTSERNFYYRNMAGEQPPVFLIEIFSVLASQVSGLINCIQDDEREDLLKYIYEWCDISPGDFHLILSNASRIRFKQEAIKESADVIQEFITMLEAVLKRAEGLDFIGQRKESIVVIKEEVNQPAAPQKRRWSILD